LTATPAEAGARAATRRAQWQIHFCVLLWGFTAILGKLITLPAIALVCWRMAMVASALYALKRVRRGLREMPTRLRWRYAGIGVVVALHWLTFYGAIKLANASVAAACIGLAPVFLAVIEPWLMRTRFDPRELGLGALVVPGVALVVGGVPVSMHAGIAVGALSALLVAVFGALNKKYVEHAEPLTMTFVELGAGGAFLWLVAGAWVLAGGGFDAAHWLPHARDTAWLLVLALACTLLPFALSLLALRNLSAFQAQLAVNLEPVYAVALAALLLGEQRELGPSFYAGVAIILGAVLAHPWLVPAKPAS
jgi:drug/metabolite transporter (DMT)-like permease